MIHVACCSGCRRSMRRNKVQNRCVTEDYPVALLQSNVLQKFSACNRKVSFGNSSFWLASDIQQLETQMGGRDSCWFLSLQSQHREWAYLAMYISWRSGIILFHLTKPPLHFLASVYFDTFLAQVWKLWIRLLGLFDW